jgi:hypothetical protein
MGTLTIHLTGKCHYGSQRQHPCSSKFRHTAGYEDAVLHIFRSLRLLHHRMHDCTTLSPETETP